MGWWEGSVGSRYLRSTHRRGFVSFVALMATLGLVLGVAVLIVVLSVMNGFERAKVHGLLTLDKHPNSGEPGDYPIAWCKKYGKGNVFYTSLGHREDVWESQPYQKHILGGIKWALGLAKGDAKPQTK